MATEATPGTGALTVEGFAPWAEGDLPTVSLSEVQRAVVSADALGANTLVDAVAGKRIRVLSLVLVASGGTNTVQLESDGGAVLMGASDIGNNGQLILPYNPAGWCQTVGGEALILDLSDAALVAGVIGYTLAG